MPALATTEKEASSNLKVLQLDSLQVLCWEGTQVLGTGSSPGFLGDSGITSESLGEPGLSEWLERKGALNPTRVHFSLYFSKHRELWRGPCKIFGDGQLHFSFSPQHKEKYNSPKKRETSAFSRQLETDFYGCFAFCS